MLYRGKFGCIAFGSGTGFLAGSYLYQQSGIVGGCCFIATAGVLHLVMTMHFVHRLLQCQGVVDELSDEDMAALARLNSLRCVSVPFVGHDGR